MENYVTVDFYMNRYNGTVLPSDKVERALFNASRHVDSLTFNRIRRIGWENLTSFQQTNIKESVCKLADFEYENEDLLESAVTGYSINGVSLNFGAGWSLHIENGVAIPQVIYSQLAQTGLTCRTIR